MNARSIVSMGHTMNEFSNADGFKAVKAAIKRRDISEVSWTLLSLAIDELQEKGTVSMGKTSLMELLRVISVQKGNSEMSERMNKVEELKEWMRKAS